MSTPPDHSSLYRSPEGYNQVMAHYDAAFLSTGIPYETHYVDTAQGPTQRVFFQPVQGD